MILEMSLNILFFVFLIVIVLTILFYLAGLILQFLFHYKLLKLSFILYNEKCLQNFLQKYSDYYLVMNMISGDKIKDVKITNSYENQLEGIIEYSKCSGERGALLRGKIKNIELSDMYIDYNNWKKIEKKLRLPVDMERYISKFIADKECNCDKIESSDDIKYFDNV
jgi:hypothetical protein